MRPLLVPVVPFALSLALSLSTVGVSVDWQDSGFYLAAVREMGALYPPGFALYLVLCKSWTLLFAFLDFTLAVHLFSSACAALAAGTVALAARDLLLSRGLIFRVSEDPPGPAADRAGAATGCLAASAFTFWNSGLLAKGYALYYLVLALLLWRMVRADGSGQRRDFTIVAALIGTAWQAHPSAVLLAPALVLFVATHRRAIGAKGIAWRTGLAAACAIGPSLLVPLFAASPTITEFDGPASLGDLPRYLLGSRFTEAPGVFGFEAPRWRSASQYLWEEFLLVGLLAATGGMVRLALLRRRRIILGMAAWIAPVVLVTLLFKTEGQHDFWLVAAWLPLWLTSAVGLAAIRSPRLLGVATVAGVAIAAIVNAPLLNRRGYDLAETYGRLYLDRLEKNAILLVITDDASAICRYLQVVRGQRTDVVIIREAELDPQGGPWRRLQARRSDLRPFSGAGDEDDRVAAFLNANVSPGRPIYVERPPLKPQLLRPECVLAPWGHLLRAPGAGEPPSWESPIEPETVRSRFRRERGQVIERRSESISVRPEAFENRLLTLLLRARQARAWQLLQSGDPAPWKESTALYESILLLRDAAESDPRVILPLGLGYAKIGRADLAEPRLRQALGLALPPRARAEAVIALAGILRRQGRESEAAALLSSVDPALLRALQERSPR